MKPHTKRLNFSKSNPCDTQASQGKTMLSSRPVPPSRALEFTRMILRRYQEKSGHWMNMGIVYLRRPQSTQVQPIHNHSTLTLEPRLSITLPSSTMILHHRIEKLTLIQHERLEARSTPGTLTSAERHPHPVNLDHNVLPMQNEIVYPPVPRVLHDATPSGSRAHTSFKRPTPGRNLSNQDSPETNVRTSSTQFKPIDVHHLTEEVIRSIDRRIIAQRERLGRA